MTRLQAALSVRSGERPCAEMHTRLAWLVECLVLATAQAGAVDAEAQSGSSAHAVLLGGFTYVMAQSRIFLPVLATPARL